MEIISSFAPVVSPESKILILGTMPGVVSLEKQEYYGYPHNAFWRIMAFLAGRGVVPAQYSDRLSMLHDTGIAVWDVCRHCRRPGSLDSHISDEVPNDIPALLAEYPGIRAVVFNGQPAHKLFKRHFGKTGILDGYEVLILPSTSPANASYAYDRKLELWAGVKMWL